MKIACPRLQIEPCSPKEFAKRINAIHEFPYSTKSEHDERAELTILSCMVALGGRATCKILPVCMVALGGRATCKILPVTGMFWMHSKHGDLLLAKAKDGTEVRIFEAYEENGEVKIRA